MDNKTKLQYIEMQLNAINQLIQILNYEIDAPSDDQNLVDMVDSLAYHSQEIIDYINKYGVV